MPLSVERGIFIIVYLPIGFSQTTTGKEKYTPSPAETQTPLSRGFFVLAILHFAGLRMSTKCATMYSVFQYKGTSMKKGIAPTSYRLSDNGREIIRKLAAHWGIGQTAAIEVTLRNIAKIEGIKLPETEKAS